MEHLVQHRGEHRALLHPASSRIPTRTRTAAAAAAAIRSPVNGLEAR
jgi:hypothetical protein